MLPVEFHMLHGTSPSMTEIVPLQLEDLRPANLSKPALLEFLQSSLTTRAAPQKAVQCLVLSASAYLPSQVDTIKNLALGIGISTNVCISAASVHVLLMPSLALAGLSDNESRQRVSSITHTTCELLTPTFGRVQLLPTERLTAARAAEQTLNRHLRLWHPPTWAETLQQELMSRSARQVIAVRSLMGPPSLAAARKLVEKQGLYMVELQVTAAELTPAAANDPADSSSSSSNGSSLLHNLLNSSGSSRRRPSTRAASAAENAGSTGAAGAGKKTEVVLVISRWPLEMEEAMQMLQQANNFTDVLLA